jgi:GNAT superfamily N-acetyltransferase
MYKIKRTTDREAVEELHLKLFGAEIPLDGTDWWLVWKTGEDEPVGFATGRPSTVKGWYFLARAGVRKNERGQGLQKRLIRVRRAWAKKQGFVGVLTYAATWNSPSIVNLLKSGFTIYDPETCRKNKWYPTKRNGFIYLKHRFKKAR